MGWASGSDVASAMIETVSAAVKDEKIRQTIYAGVIRALENHDWGTHPSAKDSTWARWDEDLAERIAAALPASPSTVQAAQSDDDTVPCPCCLKPLVGAGGLCGNCYNHRHDGYGASGVQAVDVVKRLLKSPSRRFKVRFLNHIQGTNSAEWECRVCGTKWISPENRECPNGDNEDVPKLTDEHVIYNQALHEIITELEALGPAVASVPESEEEK